MPLEPIDDCQFHYNSPNNLHGSGVKSRFWILFSVAVSVREPGFYAVSAQDRRECAASVGDADLCDGA